LKVVFDTNIFISALAIPGGQAERALETVITGKIQLRISKAIVQEVLDVLANKFSRSAEALSRTAIFLAELGEIVTPDRRLVILDDEPDNRILECAVEGDAEVIVTGDRAMLKLRTFEGIRIVTLRRFLDELVVPED
jgi:putative PIN family toxin of toxin-antitoxin system